MNQINKQEDETAAESDRDIIVCSDGFKNALNHLLSAHSQDMLKIEGEFQQQKIIWNKEKEMLVRACQKLKEQNEMLKNLVKQNRNGDSASPPHNNNTTQLATNKTQTTSNTAKKKTMVANKTSVAEQQQQEEDDGFVSKNKTKPTQTEEDQDNNNNNNGNGTGKKQKKRKSNEPTVVSEAKDELDLPLVHDNNQVSNDDDTFGSSTPGNFTRIDFKANGLASQLQSQQATSTQQVSKLKKYKFIDVVRNKDERQQLQGYECQHCKEFYDAVLGDDYDRKILLNQCSRHRQESTPPSTPPGFWDFGFPNDSPASKK